MKRNVLILLFSSLFSLDYSLEDVNDTSPTYGQFVGPSYFQNQDFEDQQQLISINYFGWETWGGWRQIFAQLCNLHNTATWDTDNAILIGIGKGLGGNSGLNGMVDQNGVNSPWVQDMSGTVWENFLGDSEAPRKQVVLLDQDLMLRYNFQYAGSSLNNSEIQELLDAIEILINELSLLGDLNGDAILNVLDVILLVNMALGQMEADLNGDLNGDDIINVLDVVLLVNIILGG